MIDERKGPPISQLIHDLRRTPEVQISEEDDQIAIVCDEAADALEKQAAEIERLRTIVDQVPKTVDGAPMRRDMWFLDDVGVPRSLDIDDSRVWYSTREAAEAAAKEAMNGRIQYG